MYLSQFSKHLKAKPYLGQFVLELLYFCLLFRVGLKTNHRKQHSKCKVDTKNKTKNTLVTIGGHTSYLFKLRQKLLHLSLALLLSLRKYRDGEGGPFNTMKTSLLLFCALDCRRSRFACQTAVCLIIYL